MSDFPHPQLMPADPSCGPGRASCSSGWEEIFSHIEPIEKNTKSADKVAAGSRARLTEIVPIFSKQNSCWATVLHARRGHRPAHVAVGSLRHRLRQGRRALMKYAERIFSRQGVH